MCAHVGVFIQTQYFTFCFLEHNVTIMYLVSGILKKKCHKNVRDVNLSIILFSDYVFGIRLVNNLDNKVLITFNARNDHDRQKFVEDLKEAVMEVRRKHTIPNKWDKVIIIVLCPVSGLVTVYVLTLTQPNFRTIGLHTLMIKICLYLN